MMSMARCQGLDGETCGFSLGSLGMPAWVRKPSTRCIFCDPSALMAALETDQEGVWADLARLAILDNDTFLTAFGRLPAGYRGVGERRVAAAARTLLPRCRVRKLRLRAHLTINALHAILASGLWLHADTRRVAELGTQLRVIGLCFSRRLAPCVLEGITA